jgi:hypothetical protein
MNKMVIQEETPVYLDGETQYSLLRYAAMAAKWKEPPRDALDTLTLTAVDMPSMDAVEQLDYMPFDPVVKVSAPVFLSLYVVVRLLTHTSLSPPLPPPSLPPVSVSARKAPSATSRRARPSRRPKARHTCC